MNYRRFVKTAKAVREKETPSFLDRLPQAETARAPFSRRRVTAFVCAAAVLAVVLVGSGVHFRRKTPTLQPSTPSAADDPAVEIRQHTVVHAKALAGKDAPTALAVYGGVLAFDCGVGSDVAAHEACSGVVYSVVDGKVFCPTHALKERLSGKISGDIRVKFLSLPLGRVLFAVGKNSFFYDFNTDTLQKCAVNLADTATVMAGEAAVFEKNFCVLEGNDPIYYLVSMKDRTVESLAKAGADGKMRTPLDYGAAISKGGRFAQYILDDGNGNTAARTNVLIDLATRAVQTFAGELQDSTPDDRYYVVKTDKGLFVYDTAERRTTAFADSGCPAQYRCGLRQLRIYSDGFYADYVLFDRETGKTIAVDGHPSATAVSRDGSTVYFFDRDKTVVDAYDLLGGEWYTLPVPDTLAAALRDNAAWEVQLALYDSGDGSVTLTYYVTQRARVTPAQQIAEESKYPGFVWDKLLENGELNSIASLRPLLERYFKDGGVTLYKGDGFAYLDTTPLEKCSSEFGESHRFVVENYAEGRFYYVDTLQGAPQVLHAARLSADAEKQTAALASACHMATADAAMTFPHLKNGKADDTAYTAERYTAAYILSKKITYCLSPAIPDSGGLTHMQHPEDIASLRGFLTYFDSLHFAASALDNGYAARFKEFYTVQIFVQYPGTEKFELVFGQNKNGSFEMLYLAPDGGHLASMTATDYATWKAWAKERIQRQHVPFEER